MSSNVPNYDSDTSTINFDYVSETAPLTGTRASQYNDDILSSSLLVEMKNLKKKPSTFPQAQTLFSKFTASNRDIEKGRLLDTDTDEPNDAQYNVLKRQVLQSWQSTVNIDRLLIQIYEYYEGKGFKVIVFQRVCSIFTVGFVVFFFLFLLNCIDYSSLFNPDMIPGLRHRKLINYIHLDRIFSISLFWGICFVIFASYWLWQVLKLIFEYNDLVKIRDIYNHLLGIPDRDLATLSIQDIIRRVIEVNEKYPMNPMEMQLDEHVIANRILRRENYFLSLLNKNILDLHPPLPFLFGLQPMLTKTIEINLSICILQFVFDSNGHIRRKFVENVQVEELALELRKRFVIMAFINLFASPFILAFLGIYFIFRYGEELYRNPKMLGTRQYTPYALCQFRELNELQAFFDERVNRSYSAARTYTSLYPSNLVEIAAKFFGFVAGSFAFILILWGLLVEDLLLDLEITTGRTMLWYIGVLGVFVAFCRSLIPDETVIYRPEELLKEVTSHLRYLPTHWKNALHTKMVRNEFSALFHYKIAIFLHEMLSVALTPYILCFSLPKHSTAIVKFFKDFSVHVNGLGYVCSFALFDFYRNGNPKYGCPSDASKESTYYQSEEGKMEKSFLNFQEKFPNWRPGPSGTMYLSKLLDIKAKKKLAHKPSKLNINSQVSPSFIIEQELNSSENSSNPPEYGPSFMDDEYKLRITSSSSSEAEEESPSLVKSRIKGKRLTTLAKPSSSSLLDLITKYAADNG